MPKFTISKTGKKSEVVAYLNDLEGPATDAPEYAYHCHAKQHAIDFVSRAQPSSEISISISGGAEDGKASVQLSMTEG